MVPRTDVEGCSFINVLLEMLNPAMQRPMVAFWFNGIAPRLPLARRVYAAGQMVRQAIAALPVHL